MNIDNTIIQIGGKSIAIYSCLPTFPPHMSLKLQFGMCSAELLADQLLTQFQWAVKISGSAQ